MVIDAKPKTLGLPTEAYIMVEEVHDVSIRALCRGVEIVKFAACPGTSK